MAPAITCHKPLPRVMHGTRAIREIPFRGGVCVAWAYFCRALSTLSALSRFAAPFCNLSFFPQLSSPNLGFFSSLSATSLTPQLSIITVSDVDPFLEQLARDPYSQWRPLLPQQIVSFSCFFFFVDVVGNLLQKMTLETQTRSLDVHEGVKKKPSTTRYGSANGADVSTPTAPIPLAEKSTPSVLADVDPSMCYVPNGYASATVYYGGKMVLPGTIWGKLMKFGTHKRENMDKSKYSYPLLKEIGYEGHNNDWEDGSRYVNPSVMEMPPGLYGDNGHIMFHHGYGYPPYGAYPPAVSSVPTVGHDGQLYGPQNYQYGGPFFTPPTPPSAPYPTHQAPVHQTEISTPAATHQTSLPVETGKGNNNRNSSGNLNGNKGSVPLMPINPNSSLTMNASHGSAQQGGFAASGYQDPRFGFDGIRSPVPWLDGPFFSDGQSIAATSGPFSSTVPSARNQNVCPPPHLMGLHSPRPSGMGPTPGFMNRMYGNNRIYGQAGNVIRTGLGFGSNGYETRANGHGWLAVDNKNRLRGRGNLNYGNENIDGLNELSKGPRAGRFKNQKGFLSNVTLAVRGQNLPSNVNSEEQSLVPARDQYNREEFPVKYSDAKFFIIKSYSEDDIHKSIKYSVWSSTEHGNKKLDFFYQESKEKSDSCPVNGSGQFVGLAEMVGPVDFNKNVEYWQQDKWNGYFPVKWHIVRDVPNSMLKHITLENNDNKPVTNSRDTQEVIIITSAMILVLLYRFRVVFMLFVMVQVKLDKGLEMLKIFKEHTSKTCILDDFGFYEARQKTMLERKAKQLQFQKQASTTELSRYVVWDGKASDTASNEKANDVLDSKTRLQQPVEPASPKETEDVLVPREPCSSSENGLAAVGGGAPKDALNE
ncbi:hypothetical protein ACLOJK_033656 [Asimina triloba]